MLDIKLYNYNLLIWIAINIAFFTLLFVNQARFFLIKSNRHLN